MVPLVYNIVQSSTNGTIGSTNGNVNDTIGSPNGTTGYIGKPMVPLATNGTIGKITNGTIGRTPNGTIVKVLYQYEFKHIIPTCANWRRPGPSAARCACSYQVTTCMFIAGITCICEFGAIIV